MIRRNHVLLPVLVMSLGSAWFAAEKTFAHGAVLEVSEVPAVQVEARYDSGEPMVEAQVSIFSPADPQTPWLRGLTDEQGQFVFVPEADDGRWTVQTRQAGHGAMAYLETSESDVPAALSTGSQPQAGVTLLQRTLMVASVVWGLVGTALFFRRRRTA